MLRRAVLRAVSRKACALTMLVGIAGGLAAAPAEQLAFRFNPPDGIVCTSTIKSVRVKDLGARGKRTDDSVLVEKQTFRKTATGYSILCKAESTKMTVNGKALGTPEAAFVNSLASVEITCDIGSDGRCMAVRGFEDVTEKLRQQLKDFVPPQVIESLPTIIEAAMSKLKTEWNGRVAGFVGRTVKIGDEWSTTGSADLPIVGEIPMPVKIRFAGIANSGGKRLVRITYRSSGGGKSLVQAVQGMIDKIWVGSAAGHPKILKVQMNTQGERLVDPSTMLIYSESYTRKSTMTMESPNGPADTKMTESRQYTNKYAMK